MNNAITMIKNAFLALVYLKLTASIRNAFGWTRSALLAINSKLLMNVSSIMTSAIGENQDAYHVRMKISHKYATIKHLAGIIIQIALLIALS